VLLRHFKAPHQLHIGRAETFMNFGYLVDQISS
jgi:hypothetical protein